MKQHYSDFVYGEAFDPDGYFEALVYDTPSITDSNDNVSYSGDFPIVVRADNYPVLASVYTDGPSVTPEEIVVPYDISLQIMQWDDAPEINGRIVEVLEKSGLEYDDMLNFEVEGDAGEIAVPIENRSLSEVGEDIIRLLKEAANEFADKNSKTFDEIEELSRQVIDKSPFVEWGE